DSDRSRHSIAQNAKLSANLVVLESIVMSKLLFMLSGIALCMVSFSGSSADAAGPLVPGTGEKLTKVGDDFEDPAWKYNFNSPKSSKNIDEQVRQPTGGSANGRWFESML